MKELIRNADVKRVVYNSDLFCKLCENKGKISVPIKEDCDKYEELFDKYDTLGSFSHDECVNYALRECRYNNFYCPNCEKGLKYKSKYPKYVEH